MTPPRRAMWIGPALTNPRARRATLVSPTAPTHFPSHFLGCEVHLSVSVELDAMVR